MLEYISWSIAFFALFLKAGYWIAFESHMDSIEAIVTGFIIFGGIGVLWTLTFYWIKN